MNQGAIVELYHRGHPPVECLHYALNLPTSVVITGCDSMKILEQALDAVHTFRPMSAAKVKVLLGKTKAAAANGEFELFKTSSIFDSTATHPDAGRGAAARPANDARVKSC